MTDKKNIRFSGFTPKAPKFLKELKRNNNKVWFEAHKEGYMEYLLKPLQHLASELSQFMLTIDPALEVRPRKVISRINRDTRFSANKSPYKSTMWLTFKRPNKDWQDAPAFFFEISSNSYRYGMGFYSATAGTMHRLREMIDKEPKKFNKLLSLYSKQKIFIIEGEEYKRVLNKSKSEDIQDWYQRKNLYLVSNRDIDNSFISNELLNDLISGFTLLKPFYYFFWELAQQKEIKKIFEFKGKIRSRL